MLIKVNTRFLIVSVFLNVDSETDWRNGKTGNLYEF